MHRFLHPEESAWVRTSVYVTVDFATTVCWRWITGPSTCFQTVKKSKRIIHATSLFFSKSNILCSSLVCFSDKYLWKVVQIWSLEMQRSQDPVQSSWQLFRRHLSAIVSDNHIHTLIYAYIFFWKCEWFIRNKILQLLQNSMMNY